MKTNKPFFKAIISSLVLFLFFVNLSIAQTYTNISGSLNGADTLHIEASPYMVTASIWKSSGDLYIEPGVEIFFAENTGFEIAQANVEFAGSESEPILLSIDPEAEAIWNGLYFSANSDNGVTTTMNHVTIEYAGNGTNNANMYCFNTDQPLVNNCTFRYADGHGIRLNNSNPVVNTSTMEQNSVDGLNISVSSPTLNQVEFINNSHAGVFYNNFTSIPTYTNCEFSGNYYGIFYPNPLYSFDEIPGIDVYNNTMPGYAIGPGEISTNQRWKFNAHGGYCLTSDMTIAKLNDKVRLIIDPGVTVSAETSSQIQVGKYVYYLQQYGGELYAVGKPDSLITFTSADGTSGGWDGIYFHNNSDNFDSESHLSYCDIYNGNHHNVKIHESLQPLIDNCEIINGFIYDIYVEDPNSVPDITATNSTVYVDGGVQSIDKTWNNFGGEYIVLNDIIVAKQNDFVTLNIEPGNTIKFEPEAGLQIAQYIYYLQEYGGQLIAEGTPSEPIIFTANNATPGGWDGIFFHYNSDEFGSQSSLKYCIVEYGNEYNVKSDGSDQPRIDECTITNSATYDIYAVQPNSVQYVTNTNSTVYVGAGVQSVDKTWYNFTGGDYVVVGDIIIGKQNDFVTLTIEPGNTIKFEPETGLQVGQYIYYQQEYGGQLFAEGTTTEQIIFTANNDSPGGWDGIFFHYNSDEFGSQSSMKYCIVEYGNEYNIKSDGSDQPRIDECTIQNSLGYDIYAVQPNSVQHITNTNSTAYVGPGTQSVNKRWYFFGGDYQILGDLIIAKQNDTCRLTINPGITIKADSGVMIQVGQYLHYLNEYGGEIYAEGKPDSIITFTSKNGQIGGWDGIYYHYNSDEFDSHSEFKYCLIENGKDHNIKCSNSIEPRIDNCTINNSGGYDIYAENPNSVPHVTESNSTIYVGGGVQSINRTWYNFGGEYIALGTIIVAKKNSFSTLTIQPGITIKFESEAKLQIGNYVHYLNNYGGEIIAEGNIDSLITFTSLHKGENRWYGIYFHYNADNFGAQSSLEYCVIEDALHNNLNLNETNILNLEHITLTNAGISGIKLSSSSPHIKLCQPVLNGQYGIFLEGSSNPIIGDTLGLCCDLYGNGDYDIYNNTNNLIHAKHNFWRTADSTFITNRIYDNNDDASLGIVEFWPWGYNSCMPNQPPSEFNLLTLQDFTITSDKTPSFTWEASIDPDSDPVTYDLIYTDDSTWMSNIIYIHDITTNNYTFTENMVSGKWYFWKVKAKDQYLSNFSNQSFRFLLDQPPVSPVLISPIDGVETSESDYLEWAYSIDEDMPQGDFIRHYHLQIDNDNDFSSPVIDTIGIEPHPDSTSVTLTILNLEDYLLLENTNYYWRVAAVDSFGVEGNFTDGSDYFLYILYFNLKVLLEGPFNGSSMNKSLNTQDLIPLLQPYNTEPWFYEGTEQVPSIPNIEIVDWVLLELRETEGDASTATPDKMIYRRVAFIKDDGSIVSVFGSNPVRFHTSFNNNIYLIIHHRNHLPVMTAEPLQAFFGEYNLNLTIDPSKVYGEDAGYKEIESNIWGMISGDFNADGIIDQSDIPIWNDNAAQKAYFPADANMDGDVDNKDKNDFWKENEGAEMQVPE